MSELSGVAWVSRFPTSRSTADLVPAFGPKADAFIGALVDAGATVHISATRRPPERAYLMHWSFFVHNGEVDPEDVPPMHGVDIEWVHKRSNGRPDVEKSRAAAAAMVHGYDIVHAPSLTSLHIAGKAIDMTIGWGGTLKIKKKDGGKTSITSLPKTGLNHALWAVGGGYGVIKLASDPPHWSISGH